MQTENQESPVPAQVQSKDTGRWSGLSWEWPERAVMALRHLEGVKSVVDIGCGRMTLRTMLPDDVAYQGVDIAARDENTIVLDLNAEQLPELDAEAATILGVMEYLDDPDRLIKRLLMFERIIITFNCYSLKDILNKFGLTKRIPRGWRHRLHQQDVTDLLKQNGFEIVALERVRYAEYLWVATRK